MLRPNGRRASWLRPRAEIGHEASRVRVLGRILGRLIRIALRRWDPQGEREDLHSGVYSAAALGFALRAILSVTITSFPDHA
jgi:hypothetical protein